MTYLYKGPTIHIYDRRKDFYWRVTAIAEKIRRIPTGDYLYLDDLKGKPGGSGAVGLFCVDKKTVFVLILGTVLAHVG